MSTRTALVGAGGMARYHLPLMVETGADIRVICEPSSNNYELALARLEELGGPTPPNEPVLAELLEKHASELDAAFIITPHNLHHDHAKMCMEAGLDVLLEKPMVTNVADARRLVDIVERTGSTLVVAYQGALSELVAQTQREVQDGTYGAVLSVSGCIWEDWKDRYQTSWKQVPALSGGGFLLDTGAHLINTMTMIVGSSVQSVSAYQNSLNADVGIVSVAAGKFENGVLFCVNGSGDTQLRQCKSEISLFFERAIVRIDAWGRWRNVETADHINPETFDISEQLIDIFCRIRNGEMTNPSDVYQGLRFSLLWDGITESINSGGQQARIPIL